MHTTAVGVTNGPAQATQVSYSTQITLTSVATATSHEQLWMISGSGWRGTAPGLWSCTVEISGGATPIEAAWQMEMTRAQCHYALPMLMIHTQFPPGAYSVTISATDPENLWDVNDQMQVAVIEMDHTGVGGGA